MYLGATGLPFEVQITTSGSGGFDGQTERGRAARTVPGPTSDGDVVVRAKNVGAAANAYTVAFVDPGAGIVNPVTTVALTANTVAVRLRRDGSGILATADEVAAAVNAVSDFGFPVVADAASPTPGLVQASAALALTGGVDPVAVDPARTQFRYAYPNLPAGVFYFENLYGALHIRKIQARFTLLAAAHLKVQTVTLTPGLGLVLAEALPILDVDLTASVNDYGVTDVKDLVLPYQAVLVSCVNGSNVPQPGTVRIYAQRANAYPF
jgi:hypothetical protein